MSTRTVTSEGLESAPWGEPQPASTTLSVSPAPVVPAPAASNVTLALGLPEREQRALDSLPSHEREEALELLATLETNSGMAAGNAYDRLSLMFGFEPAIPAGAVDSYRLPERGLDVSGLRPVTHPEHYVRLAGALWDDVRDTSSSTAGIK